MRSGLGIRPELFGPIAELQPQFGFLEAHSENYFGDSISRAKLLEFRELYPIALHGVGLSLGRADDLDINHLRQLKGLIDEIDPFIVSEHLAWSAYSHTHVPDLLPLPLTENSLSIFCRHVEQMQDYLGCQILVENPSNYLVFDQLQIPEPEFLNELASRTGCGLLIDVNNVHVSATNVKRDAEAYIDGINSNHIKQFHLAGYTEVQGARGGVEELVLIDTHNHPVYPEVWSLFEHSIKTHGTRPTLLEWDSDFPDFQVLLDECHKADRYLDVSLDIASEDIKDEPKIISANLETLDNQPDTKVSSNLTTEEQDNLESLKTEQADFVQRLLGLEGNQLPSAKQDYSHRFWIYQNNVFAALQDYLNDVFPATRGVVGEAFFKQMAQIYIQKSPPHEGNVLTYGANFGEVCRHFDGLSALEYLTDLIEFEWALHSTYYAEDESALDVTSIAQDELLSMPIRLSNNLCLLSSKFPISEIHRQSLPSFEGDVNIDLEKGEDNILVCRRYYKVIHRALEQEQLLFVKELQRSTTILQAIERVQESISPDVLSATLGLMFELCLFRQQASAETTERSEEEEIAVG